MREPKRTVDTVLIVMFLTITALPAAGLLFGGPEDAAEIENRTPAPFPRWAWDLSAAEAFPGGFRAWWNDRFPMRKKLVQGHGLLKLYLLGVSPSEQVLLGSNRWLYLNGDALESYRGTAPFSEQDLEAWQRTLERRRAWLEQRGTDYLFLIAPNKHEVYPENLPSWVRRGTTTRLDQLAEHLRTRVPVLVLDARPALETAKERGLVYHRTDPHWTARGALVVAGEIAEVLAPRFSSLRTHSTPEYETLAASFSGDLMGLAGLGNAVTETTVRFLPSRPVAIVQRGEHQIVTRSNRESRSLPDAVLLCDSFGQRLLPYLQPYFRRIVAVTAPHGRFDPHVIDRERPDVVIQEMVERDLMRPLPRSMLSTRPSF
jgi:hypothetical protein